MPGFSNLPLVRSLRVAVLNVAQTGTRARAYYRRTPARKLLFKSLLILLCVCASLILMGPNGCVPPTDEAKKGVGFVFQLFYGLSGHGSSIRNGAWKNSPRPEISGTGGAQTGTAGFLGNFTAVQEPSQGFFQIVREPNCFLGLVTVETDTDPGTVTQHYEQVLHQLASLTTTADVFPKGCAETSTRISSRPGVFVGGTTNQVLVFAAAGPNGANNATYLYRVSSSGVAETTDTSLPAATALATGDLNGDGNNDLVIVNGYNAASAFVSVELGNADGTSSLTWTTRRRAAPRPPRCSPM